MNTLSQYPPGKAMVFEGQGRPFVYITSPVRSLQKGEILVKNLYTTLCGSDLHTFCGRRMEPAKVVLGHEIVGEVLILDKDHSGLDFNGETIQQGDRITWSIFVAPVDSNPPRPDIPQKSDHLFKYGHALVAGNDVFNGGLADYCILRSNTALLKISESIPLPVAATINCAQATTMGALRVAGEIAGKNIMIFGLGLLGLSCAAMCREAGALSITAVDNNLQRLNWAAQFGTTAAYIIPQSGSALPWPAADIVFDMTGDTAAMQMGIDSLAIGGIAVWIGAVYPNKPVMTDAQQIVRKLLQIRGLHNYNYQDFVNATAFIEKNHLKYPFGKLTEKEFHLDKVQEAFEFAVSEKPVRVGINLADQH